MLSMMTVMRYCIHQIISYKIKLKLKVSQCKCSIRDILVPVIVISKSINQSSRDTLYPFSLTYHPLMAANAAANPTTLKLPPLFKPGLAAGGSLFFQERKTAFRSRGAPSNTTVETGTKGRSCADADKMP
jgi:hypothetical protein